VNRALKPHLDPGSAPLVQKVECDAWRARSREELDRDGGQPERNVEILDRARHGVV
jgi:hypothetical protein